MPTPLLRVATELTRRERQIVLLITTLGVSDKTIAGMLNISEETVSFHKRGIFAKLQVRSVRELFVVLRENTPYTTESP